MIRAAVIALLKAAVWSATIDDHDPDEFRVWCRAWDDVRLL